MRVNGAAIYGSSPWTCQNDTVTSGVWYTSKGRNVFGIVLRWRPQLELGCVKPAQGLVVSLLGVDGTLKWWEEKKEQGSHISIQMPPRSLVRSDWVVQIKNIQIP